MSHWNARTSRRRSLFRHDVRQRAFQYADESGAENHRTERKEKGLLNAAKSDCSYPIEMFVASAFYRVPRLKAIATRSRPFSHGRTCTRKTHTHTKTCWFHFEYSQHLLLSTCLFSLNPEGDWQRKGATIRATQAHTSNRRPLWWRIKEMNDQLKKT